MREDTRIKQVQALTDDARTLLADMEEEGGHTPVDRSRLIQARQYLDNTLATLDWFTRRYPGEAS